MESGFHLPLEVKRPLNVKYSKSFGKDHYFEVGICFINTSKGLSVAKKMAYRLILIFDMHDSFRELKSSPQVGEYYE